jgi:hypothetical protein
MERIVAKDSQGQKLARTHLHQLTQLSRSHGQEDHSLMVPKEKKGRPYLKIKKKGGKGCGRGPA